MWSETVSWSWSSSQGEPLELGVMFGCSPCHMFTDGTVGSIKP